MWATSPKIRGITETQCLQWFYAQDFCSFPQVIHRRRVAPVNIGEWMRTTQHTMHSTKFYTLCLSAVAAFQLTAAAETVTIFSNGHSPHASSAAYAGTYSQEHVITEIYTNAATTNVYGFTNWVVTVRSNEIVRVQMPEYDSYLISSDWLPVESGSVWHVFQSGTSRTPTIVGPCRITLEGFTSGSGFLTLAIQRNDEFNGPQNTVAIPPDASGPVTVHMETSTNLVQWVSASPGSYGVSTATRYFRLRPVVTP